MKRAAEEIADDDHDQQRRSRSRRPAAAAARRRWRRPRAVGCSTITVQPSGAIRAATPSCVAAVLVDVFARDRACRPAARATRRAAGGRPCCASARRAPSCRDRRARSARRRARRPARSRGRRCGSIDHPPHFLEAELADEPAGRLVQARQVDGEDAGRQQVVVDADRRHRRRRRSPAARPSGSPRAACRRGSWRSIAPASSNSVISRNSRNCRT